MRIARFDDNLVGLVLDDGIHDVTSALSELPPYRYPLPAHDVLIANLPKLTRKFDAAARPSPPIALENVKLLSPVANPGKIMAAPVNYTRHLEEVLADKGIHHGNLVSEIHKAGIFLKASSSVVGPGEGVRLVPLERRNDHEVELAEVIGKRGRNIAAPDALGFVAGYCIVWT
jgi:2-keto-4-pentenoate hydratase/2-oxohepta-3-ene-1,7-dioic acid hydratase in catechol pathway